ncbi:MAG TPA: 4a-hydroxytetrahydrobiopterin dehydratase [Candidatus Nanopelagicaceae bacterium]|nr:4a-hydroxytetrahydrobiopterin dehydratase [Candidatus Nanopelagicaceae bacterium]
MAELVREHCQPCHGRTPQLAAAEAAELLAELDSAWQSSEGTLRRRFQRADFAAAFALGTGIALLAEREGHHPDLRLGWGYLEVELTTHAAGGLTRNDFVMAAKIDRIDSGSGGWGARP